MYIVVHHQVTDPEKFLSIIQASVPDSPYFKAHAFLPTINRHAASYRWEDIDTTSLQKFLDPILGNSSNNTYLEADENIAIGLPKQGVMELEEN
jgi:hypothetical protein